MKRIDYDLVYDERDRQWLVWTPDKTGGVIGSGAARTTALLDAILNLNDAIAQMKNEVQALDEEVELMIALINGDITLPQASKKLNVFPSRVVSRCYVVISNAIAQGKIPKIKNGK